MQANGQGLRPQVVQKFQACAAEKNLRPAAGCPISIMDAEQKKFFVFDQGGKCLLNTAAGISGRGSHPGNGHGSNLTPSGLFLTKVHRGSAYGPSNSVGISCVSSAECSNTVARGVIIHASRRSNGASSTLGCTSLPIPDFRKYHQIMSGGNKACPHFAYFPQGQCGKSGAAVRRVANVPQPRRTRNGSN